MPNGGVIIQQRRLLSRSSSGVSWWPVCPPAMCALRRRRAFCGAIRYTFPQAASAEAICPCWSIKNGESGQWSACCPTSARRTVRCACLHAKARCSIFGSPARCSLFLWRCAAWPLTQCRRFCPCFSYRWCLPSLGCWFRWRAFSVKACTKIANRYAVRMLYPFFYPALRLCVHAWHLSYTLLENPFSVSGGRCDVRVHLPCGLRYRVRGALQYLAREIPFTL